MEKEDPLVVRVKGTSSTQGQFQVTAHVTGMTAVPSGTKQPCFAAWESAMTFK